MKLEQLRRARVLPIEELVKKAEVSPSTVSQIERGHSKPRRFETVRKLAAALEVEPQQVEEFQHLVGKPESLLDRVPQERWDAILAETEKTPEADYIPFDEMMQRVQQRRAQRSQVAA